MRVALAAHTARVVGGVESYLADLVPCLLSAGHEVALLAEHEGPTAQASICGSTSVPVWVLEDGERMALLDQLAAWDPSLVFAHGLSDLDLKQQLAGIAPAVHFAHDYRSTCVSGYKAWAVPSRRPCTRRLGWGCLLHYYPHRCGGLSPATMQRDYSHRRRRLDVLRSYRAVVTNSEHLAHEYARHGFDRNRVHAVPMFVEPPAPPPAPRSLSTGPLRLVVAGRMERHKGGEILLDALLPIRKSVGRDIELTMAGDGSLRSAWEQRAREVERHGGVVVRFPGWLDRTALGAMMVGSDVLVLPSTWPEPFGRIGPEAGLLGTPTVAFAVGGIPEWLEDGVNGCLAPADPPTAEGLAEAIARTLADGETWSRLSENARAVAARFSPERHVRMLMAVLARYAR